MHVHGEITGLTPGEHGFHVHEFGVWNQDGMASGGHFNPTSAPHASHDSEKRHVGDLGNVKADESGKAVIDLEDDQLSFEGPDLHPRPRPGRAREGRRPEVAALGQRRRPAGRRHHRRGEAVRSLARSLQWSVSVAARQSQSQAGSALMASTGQHQG